MQRVKRLLGIALAPKQTIDAVGVPALATGFVGAENEMKCPKVVMLSSAGVTRPTWNDEKKAMFPGSAEIPIVRLNPFGILDIKRESEEKLRETGKFSVVAPLLTEQGSDFLCRSRLLHCPTGWVERQVALRFQTGV